MYFDKVAHNDLSKISNLQPEGWPDIVPEFEFYMNSEFCTPIKTQIDNKIVGIGASIIFGNSSWIAHIIVDKDYRKKGIGLAITEKLIKITKDKSIETCLLIASDLGFPVYKKFGFKIVSEYCYFKRDKPWTSLSVSKNVIPYRNEYYSMVIGLDKKITGENREKLLIGFLDKAILYFDKNKVEGYYIPGLCEGPILSDTLEAGTELMKVKYSKVDKAVLPSENSEGIKFLKKNGFVEAETKGTRMKLGKDINWKPEKIFSRIGGNFG